MVSNSAQLDRRTKQHTQFAVSASNGSRDMGRTKSWRKKKRKKKKEKKNERRQSHIASPTGIANYDNNTAELKDVTSRLIILINEEINKANWMVSISAKLDRWTKQHTQFGVSASNGSRDMARTKSWREKKKKKSNEANWMVSNSAKLDRRTKQHIQFGVSASNGSRDMARAKSWRKKRKEKK